MNFFINKGGMFLIFFFNGWKLPYFIKELEPESQPEPAVPVWVKTSANMYQILEKVR